MASCVFRLKYPPKWRCPHPAQRNKDICIWHNRLAKPTRKQFEEALSVSSDFSGAILNDLDLSGVNLRKARLQESFLIGVDLQNANLQSANFNGARMLGVELAGANLHYAHMIGAELRGVFFIGSNVETVSFEGSLLSSCIFREVSLKRSRFTYATIRQTLFHQCSFLNTEFGETAFLDSEFTGVNNLEHAYHAGPSRFDISTLVKSGEAIPTTFLRSAGVHDTFLTYLPSLLSSTSPLEFYSCFICYSNDDLPFAERLREDLEEKKVQCWFFPETATFGKKVIGEIDQAIRNYDKTLVICSEHSLQSGPVLREIERALQREEREGGTEHLFPIRIDDYIFDKWNHPRKADVVDRVIADFRPNQDYDKQFARLISALETSRKQVLEGS